jgi:hypothetical protein
MLSGSPNFSRAGGEIQVAHNDEVGKVEETPVCHFIPKKSVL